MCLLLAPSVDALLLMLHAARTLVFLVCPSVMLVQALVQYPNDATAAMAKQSLDGYHMYPGGKNRVSMLGQHSPTDFSTTRTE
jgi:hypothetical protein